jgi:hypothetical protein
MFSTTFWTWREIWTYIIVGNWTPTLKVKKGHVIAQAVSRRLPMAVTLVRAQVKPCLIRGGQSGTGAGFLQVLCLPSSILIPPTAPHSSSIIRGWYNRPISGRHTKRFSLTPSQVTKVKIYHVHNFRNVGTTEYSTLTLNEEHVDKYAKAMWHNKFMNYQHIASSFLRCGLLQCIITASCRHWSDQVIWEENYVWWT